MSRCVCVEVSRQLSGDASFLLPPGSQDETQVTSLGCMHPYLLSQLTGSVNNIFICNKFTLEKHELRVNQLHYLVLTQSRHLEPSDLIGCLSIHRGLK